LVEEAGRRGSAVACDVMQTEQLDELVATTLARFGRLDVLVNNAGGTGPRPAMATSERFFEHALRFNVTAPFLLTQRAARAMVDTAGGGSVVNISSRSADMVLSSFAAYGAGKAALNQVTRVLAAELAPRVRVNAIGVGGIATRSLDVVLTNPDLRRQFEANTPLERAGEPEEVAAAVVYLASPASSYTTGRVLHVDGGVNAPSIDVPAPPLEPTAGEQGSAVRPS
jgi:7-alpha-hydroxysteroid dehydrogenase